MNENKMLLDASGLSDYLSLPRSSIYTMVSRRKLPGVVKLGRALRFERTTIDAWVAGQRVESGPGTSLTPRG